MKQTTLYLLILFMFSSHFLCAQDKKKPVEIVHSTISAQTIKIGSAEHKNEWPTKKIPPATTPGLPLDISLEFLNDSTVTLVVKSLSGAASLGCKCSGKLSIKNSSQVTLPSSKNTEQVPKVQESKPGAYRLIEFINPAGEVFKTETDPKGNFSIPAMPAGKYTIRIAETFKILDYSN